jgi:agmatinase
MSEPDADRFEPPDSFLGLPAEETRYEDARVVVLPIPYEGTVSYQGGASRGPRAILDASREVELYDEELGTEPWRAGIHTLPPLAVAAGGPAAMEARIRAVADELGRDGKLVLALGGEHGVTPPLVASLRARAEGEVSVLLIDAHADLRPEYGGTELSHACTAYRVLDGGPVAVVGPRAFCREESDIARERGVGLFPARELAGRRPGSWIPEVLERLGPDVYVSFDVDGLDPAIMPATGTPVPGGLGWWDALALLRAVGESRRILGVDVVELAPIPGLVAPDFLAAQLAHKLLAYALMREGAGESGRS